LNLSTNDLKFAKIQGKPSTLKSKEKRIAKKMKLFWSELFFGSIWHIGFGGSLIRQETLSFQGVRK